MPELPEVETIKQRLSQVLPGKVIQNISVLKDKSFSGDRDRIVGQKISHLERRAKIIIIVFENNYYLVTHLKMTGQLIYQDEERELGGGHPTADWVNQLPGDHTRIVYDLSDKARLFFNDMRIFGWMRVMTQQELRQELSKYGPDVTDQKFSADYLHDKLQNRTIAIKRAIMVNKICAGIGNIYASEVLFKAGIDPFIPAKKVCYERIEKLVPIVKKVMKEAIKLGGTTFDGKYVNIDGISGNYQDELEVYGREGEPCLVCGHEILKEKIGNRGTYYCPECQV